MQGNTKLFSLYCCRPKTPKTFSPTKQSPPQQPNKQIPVSRNMKLEILLTIPNCKVHLMEEGEALELASGDLETIRLSDENVVLATILKVGDDLQWPLTKDEPIIKLGVFHYLFSLPIKDGDDEALSYGVTFTDGAKLGSLDSFLRENSCFSCLASSTRNKNLDWKEFAPAVQDYNNFLAKAIAGGTGKIVKGIFKCSNAYTNQVQKGGEMILTQAAEKKKSTSARSATSANKTGLNKSLKRVRKVSKMIEKISKRMLDGVGIAAGSVMEPVVQSKAGKAFLATVPGEVLLASLDALNKVLDAAEAAEKQAFAAAADAAARMVNKRFGENAGKGAEDALAAAGHCVGAAWNVVKARKAVNPARAVALGVLKNAERKNIKY